MSRQILIDAHSHRCRRYSSGVYCVALGSNNSSGHQGLLLIPALQRPVLPRWGAAMKELARRRRTETAPAGGTGTSFAACSVIGKG